jgi:hypothetical protein
MFDLNVSCAVGDNDHHGRTVLWFDCQPNTITKGDCAVDVLTFQGGHVVVTAYPCKAHHAEWCAAEHGPDCECFHWES